ncbi:MAG: hypothetical protein WA117_10940 [Verrucomicrobiia bacterium]
MTRRLPTARKTVSRPAGSLRNDAENDAALVIAAALSGGIPITKLMDVFCK